MLESFFRYQVHPLFPSTRKDDVFRVRQPHKLVLTTCVLGQGIAGEFGLILRAVLDSLDPDLLALPVVFLPPVSYPSHREHVTVEEDVIHAVAFTGLNGYILVFDFLGQVFPEVEGEGVSLFRAGEIRAGGFKEPIYYVLSRRSIHAGA